MGNKYDDYNVSEQEIGEWIKDHERLLFEVVHRYAYIPEHIGCVRTLQMDKDTYDNQYGQSEFDDYFQAACIGVVKAVRTYESTNRTKFSTYAFKCAKNEVLMINRQKQAGKRGASVCFSEMSLRAFGTGEKNISSEETLGLYGTRDGEKWSNELMETFLATHTTSSCCQSLSMDPANLCSDKVFAEEIIRYAETLHTGFYFKEDGHFSRYCKQFD